MWATCSQLCGSAPTLHRCRRCPGHTDAASIAEHGPPEQYRAQWPDYPHDLALIRFTPQRLEVMGKGVMPSREHWQPQGVGFP